jgi:phosphatidylglycerophosphate synthase
MAKIPFVLVWIRLALSPCFLIGYFAGGPGWLYVTMLLVGIVSDIFDGVLARRWNCVTPGLRRFDSNVDTLFYGLAGVTAVLLRSAFLSPWLIGFAVMFGLFLTQNVINGIRYGRQPSYHMWSGKLWSIALVVALTGLFINRPAAWAIDLVIVLGIYNSLEGIIASLISDKPVTDVRSVFDVIQLVVEDKFQQS